jgi:hypothetical protein
MSPDNDDIFQRHLPMTSSNAVLQRHPPMPSFNDILRRRLPTTSSDAVLQRHPAPPLLTRCVSDLRAFASVSIAPAKHPEIIALVTAQRNGLDDGRRYGAQEQQDESQKEYDRQRRCRAQHRGRPRSNECGVAEDARSSGEVGRWVARRPDLDPGRAGRDSLDAGHDQTEERRRSSMRESVSQGSNVVYGGRGAIAVSVGEMSPTRSAAVVDSRRSPARQALCGGPV